METTDTITRFSIRQRTPPHPVVARKPTRAAVPLLLLLVLLVGLLAAGCGSARAGRFEAFARAGHHYSAVRNSFLEQSLETAIARDTMELRLGAEDEDDPAARLSLLKEHDEGMRERMEIIRDLERHAQVRDLYFSALADLAGAKGTARAGQAANALAGQIASLTGAMSQRTLFGRPVNQLIGQVTGATVASFRNKALERHLQNHAATIERELALEEGLLSLLSKIMMEDLTALHQARRRDQLNAPLLREEPLPTGWNATREQLLLAEFDMGKLEAARQAATELRQAYRQLIEDDGKSVTLNTVHLEFAMQRLSDAITSIRATR